RCDLAALGAHRRLDPVHQLLDIGRGDGPLVGRVQERCAKLDPVEPLPLAASLGDVQRRRPPALEGREAMPAARALAPSANGASGLGATALEDAGGRLAHWTYHCPYCTSPGVLLL